MPLTLQNCFSSLSLTFPHLKSGDTWGRLGSMLLIQGCTSVMCCFPPLDAGPAPGLQGSIPFGETWPQRHPRLRFSLQRSACQGAVSTASRSNQHPKCREGGLDRQTAQTHQPPPELSSLSQPHEHCGHPLASPLGATGHAG